MCGKLPSWIRAADLLGIQVTLTHKGEPAFKSVCGGLITILLTIGLALYFIKQLDLDWHHPEYFTTPPEHDSWDDLAYIQNKDNMIAYLIFNPKADDQN